MTRLLRLAARLYPSWWRQRYAREFEALLDDLQPGWRGLADIVHGALTMRMKTLGTVPAVCALAGAIVGGIIAMRSPEVFASSATIRLTARESANADSPSARPLRVSFEKALGASRGTREATLVMLHRDDPAQATLKLMYRDRDPVRAQRVAEQLTAAIATENSGQAASTEVLEAPSLPTSPIKPDYPGTVASGGGAGFLAGGLVFLVVRSRRRPSGTP